jgi:hypothetical protein
VLVDAYEKLRKSPRLTGVALDFGGLHQLGVHRGDRVLMVPSEDKYQAPQMARARMVLGGQKVEGTSIALRGAGAKLYLTVYATGDLGGYRQMERLIVRVHLALHETLHGYGNFAIEDAEWMDRDAIADGLLGYVQPIRVLVPVADLLPVHAVKDVDVHLPTVRTTA